MGTDEKQDIYFTATAKIKVGIQPQHPNQNASCLHCNSFYFQCSKLFVVGHLYFRMTPSAINMKFIII